MPRPRVRLTMRWMMILGLGVPASAAFMVAALLLRPAQAAPPETVSLMETLSQWKYPGSTMLGGASMSDGGNPLVQSIKCRAVLTTPDPIEKVVVYYSEKLEAPRTPRGRGGRGELKDADAKSVSTQDDSEGRPVTIRVFAVNKADTSTTLVISRTKDEKETHIAWLHYLRLEGK